MYFFHIIGIFTGSPYSETTISEVFKGGKVTDGRVIAVKIHQTDTAIFDRAILLHRDIKSALIADANRRRTGGDNIGVSGGNIFKGKGAVYY